MNNFESVVSLGYNCLPNSASDKNAFPFTKDCFFDDIITPMWAIKDLLVNNFDGFYDKSKYDKMKLFDMPNSEFLTNKQYYIRFTQTYQHNKLNAMFNLFKIRQENLISALQSKKKMLFIRYEEAMITDSTRLSGKRIIYPEYVEKYKKNELYYLTDFSTYLQKTYPQLNFTIMFISNPLSLNETNLDYIKDSKIITIPSKKIDKYNYVRIINQIFDDNADFINESVKN